MLSGANIRHLKGEMKTMKRNTMLFALAAALLCAAGAFAQDPAPTAPAAGQGQTTAQPSSQSKDMKSGKNADKKAAWENGVKTDCAAEIADGGVCAGKDFGSGLEKCLHKNRSKLSDGCKAAVRPHRGMKSKKGGKMEHGAKSGGAEQAPVTNPAPAPAPQQ